MRGTAEAGLPITTAPIPRRIEQRRLLCQQLLNARQDAFYGAPEWRQGPRERVLAMIRHYQDAVLWASPETLNDLRSRNPGDAAPTG